MLIKKQKIKQKKKSPKQFIRINFNSVNDLM